MENTKKQLWILVTVCLFTFMSVLDSSIVNIALPTISKELEITLTHSEWIVSSYLLVICCSLLLFGKLGDTFGKAKIFKIGGIIFIIGSALCGFSNSLPMLVVSRIIQAVGSGMTMSNNNGIITETFAPNQRGRALGMVGAFVSLGAITGPGLGGLLLAQFSWNSIFLVNVPIGIIGVLLGYRILPVRKRTGKERIDYLGFILLALTILSMYASIQFIQSGNIFQWPVFIFTGLFLGSCYFFLHWENRIEKPLLQLSLFSNKIFSESLLSAFLVFISAFFYTMIMRFYLQDIKGYTASDAGLIMMVFPIVQVILAPIAGYFY
ncbi:MFS transporter [Enterococcus italicus]|uniref:MFS transporter n=1 Tax=Enterococcus italicus TaxID=246144 RepID=UPI003FA2B4DB